jgi:hypothetical protein
MICWNRYLILVWVLKWWIHAFSFFNLLVIKAPIIHLLLNWWHWHVMNIRIRLLFLLILIILVRVCIWRRHLTNRMLEFTIISLLTEPYFIYLDEYHILITILLKVCTISYRCDNILYFSLIILVSHRILK